MITRRLLLGAAAAVSMLGFGTLSYAQDKGLVGISMPTKSSVRWISDGDSMVKEFTALGYTTDL